MPTKSKQPEKTPPVAAATEVKAAGSLQPGREPPLTGLIGETAMSETQPKDLSTEEAALTAQSGGGGAQPSISPPEQAASSGGITAWQGDKRISGLWSINQDRNAWVAITNIGWKKLATASASGLVALNLLGAHARQTNSRVDYRDEADDMIHEMYIW